MERKGRAHVFITTYSQIPRYYLFQQFHLSSSMQAIYVGVL